VVMPHMNGLQLVQQLTAIQPDLKVLFISGYTESAIHLHGLNNMNGAFLAKPYTPDLLARKVREVLDS